MNPLTHLYIHAFLKKADLSENLTAAAQEIPGIKSLVPAGQAIGNGLYNFGQWVRGNPAQAQSQALQNTNTALDAANKVLGPGAHPGVGQAILKNQPAPAGGVSASPLNPVNLIRGNPNTGAQNQQTVNNANTLLTAAANGGAMPGANATPAQGAGPAGAAAAVPAAKPQAPATPAPGATHNQAYWGALFRKYHGSHFDPNSSMDKVKMTALMNARQGGSSMATAANVTGPQNYRNLVASGSKAPVANPMRPMPVRPAVAAAPRPAAPAPQFAMR